MRWLKRLEEASAHCVEDLKSGAIKRTLKVLLPPNEVDGTGAFNVGVVRGFDGVVR